MLFNSLTFVVFFLCVVAVHYLPLPWRAKKLNLLVASYLFYAAWNPPFVLLLWISTVVDWWAARWIAAARSAVARRAGLVVSLSVNLGLLAFFKYGNFALENFVRVASAIGVEYSPPRLDIVLPVGISFYTFQSLSYTLDVHHGRTRPWKSPLDFALYVTFFPQLVAGPIVRAVDFLPQCVLPQAATARQFAWGLNLLVIGLFEKIVVADAFLAPIVERVYGAPQVDTLSAWVGTLAFAGQIFCDFAGYSTCAIGAAMCLGFALPDNFRYPYAAVGFSDFWRRWHVSLSSWLRDYLYIPLGGNRGGFLRTMANLMITMVLGGLWHGASWTFVVWGALHGAYLALERVVRKAPIAGWALWQSTRGRKLLALGTFLLVCFTWVFFRADSLPHAAAMVRAMIVPDAALVGDPGSAGARVAGKRDTLIVFSIISAMLAIHWRLRDTTLEHAFQRLPSLAWCAANAAMIAAILISPGEDRAFIYFQF